MRTFVLEISQTETASLKVTMKQPIRLRNQEVVGYFNKAFHLLQTGGNENSVGQGKGRKYIVCVKQDRILNRIFLSSEPITGSEEIPKYSSFVQFSVFLYKCKSFYVICICVFEVYNLVIFSIFTDFVLPSLQSIMSFFINLQKKSLTILLSPPYALNPNLACLYRFPFFGYHHMNEIICTWSLVIGFIHLT